MQFDEGSENTSEWYDLSAYFQVSINLYFCVIRTHSVTNNLFVYIFFIFLQNDMHYDGGQKIKMTQVDLILVTFWPLIILPPTEILANKQIVICRHEMRSFMIVAIRPPPWVQQTSLLAHGLLV